LKGEKTMLKQHYRYAHRSAIALAGLLALVAYSHAADKAVPVSTTIAIDGMHCAACAKKVSKKLQALPNVMSAKVDVKTSLASITPQKDKTLSPRMLWESVEAAGYQPTKIDGPSGTFTTKPKL